MSRWKDKYVIGLTGNIAVGKSVVRQMLQHLGAYTIDADGLTHRAMSPGAPAYQPIVNTFGQFILDGEKKINRALLGNVVFSQPVALAKLESIVHPIVGQAIAALVSRATQQIVVIEAIKLLEGQLADAVDEIWVVNAAPETQVKRLMEKRKMSEADAKLRVSTQNAQSDKLAKATVVINNDGNVEETWKQVQAAWGEMMKRAQGQAPAAPAPATPAAPAAPSASPAAAATPAAGEITVRRGMPNNAEAIAAFLNQTAGKDLNRMDVMMAFGNKSYLIAQDQKEAIHALVGWQVENLITRVDEFYVGSSVPPEQVVGGLVDAIELASKDLQSEVGFIFLPLNTPKSTIDTFIQHGYSQTTVDQIKIPAWRESAQEIMSQKPQSQILTKRLREDRVLKPI
ncbi:MAG: dephospho-CoA kinase [Anaerolineaceae bacterium]|nr:dephospho-CoA kinase [Anaerolineaceae bacterium]